MGDIVIYRYQNTVRVGQWIQITKNHKAVIKSFKKGNEAYLIRSMKQILSLKDLVNNYGLESPEMTPEQQKDVLASGIGRFCGMHQKRV